MARQSPGPRKQLVTPRQRQVIELALDGLTYKEIAYELGISAQTVKNHLTMLYAETGSNNLLHVLRQLGAVRLPWEVQVA